jgi:hypothetical protein
LVIFVIAGIVVVSGACYASVVVVATVSMSMSMSIIRAAATSGEGGGPVEDELAFLVPLALVEGDEVFPAEDGSAGDAEDVADGVQPRGHHPVVLATNIHVHAAYNKYVMFIYLIVIEKRKRMQCKTASQVTYILLKR